MIRVSFLAPDLSRWDGVSADVLCLSFFSDERPFRGTTGLADWRMCGALSRCVLEQKMTGEIGDVLLMPVGRKLPFGKILLFGLGTARGFSDLRYRDAVRRIWEVSSQIQARRIAIAPPGRERESIPPRRALELLLQERGGADGELLVIEPLAGQKEMATVLRQQRG